MSNYYVQTNATGQPGQMYFSDWAGNENQGQVGALNMGGAPLIPEPPVQYANHAPNSNQVQQQSYQADPNATPLVREHFRTSRDNAIPRSSRSDNQDDNDNSDSQKCGDSKLLMNMVVGGLILIIFIALIVYACQSGSTSNGIAPQGSSSNVFGSATLNANLLNDLEFL
jgi:hypothetical protein